MVPGGFTNATVQRSVGQCVAPSARRSKLPLKIALAFSGDINSVVLSSVVDMAIDQVVADPQMFDG